MPTEFILGDGYYHLEFDNVSNRPFRWTSDEFVLHTIVKNDGFVNTLVLFNTHHGDSLININGIDHPIVTGDNKVKIYGEYVVIKTPHFIPNDIDNQSADMRKLGLQFLGIEHGDQFISADKIEILKIPPCYNARELFPPHQIKIDMLKSFDGEFNYFNPSCFNGKIIYRKEHKFNNSVLISDIVDSDGNVLLSHKIDNEYLWSFEDARFVSETEISVCCCKRNIKDLFKIVKAEFKKFNLSTKTFTDFKTQNKNFEKHWQFYNDKIIYHINPYTILDKKEIVIYKKKLNWDYWIRKYGCPGLSTNVFDILGKKFLLYHSYIQTDRLCYKYFVGVMRIDDNLQPIGYLSNPLFVSNVNFSDNQILTNLWRWRKTEITESIKYEVIFPMSVVVTENEVLVYSGMNDCSCVCIRLDLKTFNEKIMNEPIIID